MRLDAQGVLFQGRTESVVRRRRISEGVEEARRLLAAERQGVVSADSSFRILQRTRHNEGADGLALDGSRVFDARGLAVHG